MAELPDLGKNCHLCNQLDYTPFFCNKCNKDYCSLHRFKHSCDMDDNYINDEDAKKNPMKIYLCSYQKCNTKEVVKIVCDTCKLNFCLFHKNLEGHDCKYNSKISISKPTLPQPILEKIKEDERNKEVKSNEGVKVKKVKILTEKEKKKMESLEMMKLKMRPTKYNIPENEKFVLFLTLEDSKILGVIVSNQWMFGRCISEFLNQNSKFKNILTNVKYFDENLKEISFSDSIKDIFKDSVGRVTYQEI
uniref:AN1-type domain-containing protein n=1 Tax=Parastrongyloides trichosuri TaxID=131310 RepID=A0A0N4ZQW0_PARTI